MKANDSIRPVLTTLIGHGIGVRTVEPVSGGYVLSCTTVDRFGCEIPYEVVVALEHASPAGVALARERARQDHAHVVYVGPEPSPAPDCPCLRTDEFLARFGGPIDSLLVLESDYANRLATLGRNRLPFGEQGVASDLFEIYVAAGLQFLLGRKVLHYGRKRSGERVPDGIALAGAAYCLFDAKAAESGFEFEADTIRQFASYARDFSDRYSNLGAPHAFVCVSGSFNDDDAALAGRARDLYAEARLQLVTLNATELGRAVEFLRQNIHLRQFTDWKRLLSSPILAAKDIERSARAAERDGLAPKES